MKVFCARQNTVAHLSQLQLGFRRCRIWVSVSSHIGSCHRRGVLRPLFRTLHGLLGYQRSSILFRPVCPLLCRSDWLANPITCPSFPRLALPLVDSLDSKLWYRSGCRAAALASAAPRPLGNLFGSFSPRGARSKGDQQPDGRVAHNQKLLNIIGADTKTLVTRVLRARKGS